MTKSILSLAQFQSIVGDIDSNLEHAIGFIKQARDKKAQLILFPELWTSGYSLGNPEENAAKNIIAIEKLNQYAKDYQISIAGSYILKENGQIYNRFLLIDPRVGILPVYDKVHLFQLTGEEKTFSSGRQLTIVDEPWGKTALTICYDLRFPELYRRLAVDGARVILVPAQWPERRIQHWNILLQARAIEDQCYLLGCNSVGTISGDVYGGNSAIIDPWGKILAQADGRYEELLLAEIDTEVIDKARATIPVFSDRRADLY